MNLPVSAFETYNHGDSQPWRSLVTFDRDMEANGNLQICGMPLYLFFLQVLMKRTIQQVLVMPLSECFDAGDRRGC